MATSVEYPVAAILQVKGGDKAEAELNKLGRASDRAAGRVAAIAQSAAGGLASIGGFVGGAIDSLASFAVRGGAALGAAGVGGAILALKTGLIDVNAKMEESKLGFATIFNMFGASAGVEHGLQMSSTLIEQIRDDAKALPGEFGDFVGMAQTLTAPILAAGAGMKQIRGLTSDTVIAASALGIRFDQASREMAMLLEGHAGGHNVLGTRLGIGHNTQVNGKDFNKASQSDRLDYITKALAPAKESLARFQVSWSGLTSTLVDTAKQLVGRATAPLFERLRNSMQRLLQWTEAHQEQINRLADVVGQRLVYAWGWIEEHVERLPFYFQKAKNFAKELIDGFHDGMQKIMPLVDRAGALLERAFAHPMAAIKMLAGLRLGASALGMAPGMLSAGSSMASMLGGGGGGAAAAAGGEAAGAAGGVAAGAGGATAATVAAVALPVIAVGVAMVDNTLGAFDRFKATFVDLFASVSEAFGAIIEKGGLLRDAFGLAGAGIVLTLQIAIYPITFAFKALALVLDLVNTGWSYLKDALSWVANMLLTGLGSSLDGATKSFKDFCSWIGSIKDAIMGLPGMARILGGDPIAGATHDEMAVDHPTTANEFFASSSWTPPPSKNKAVTAAPSVDARGSHITLQLNVKDNDPDRLIRRVYGKLGETLVRPISTSRAPAPGF